MKDRPILQDTSAIASLAKKLARSADVPKFDGGVGDPEAWALAHVLSEFEESCSNCLAILPRLLEADATELNELLLDFGEGLRNIVSTLRIPDTTRISCLRAWRSEAAGLRSNSW